MPGSPGSPRPETLVGGARTALPPDVADVLDAVLDAGDPVHAVLLRQAPYAVVRDRCSCGCGTASFEVDRDSPAVEAAPTGPGTVVAAEAPLFTEDGECPGEVLVFAHAGYLASLEVCSWSDDIEVTLVAAGHWSRRCR